MGSQENPSPSFPDLSSDDPDLISQLPNHIIHEILSSFTSREWVPLAFQSKKFREAWLSTPSLVFHLPQNCKQPDDERRFMDFANAYIRHREDGIRIEKFVLRAPKQTFRNMEESAWHGLRSCSELAWHGLRSCSGNIVMNCYRAGTLGSSIPFGHMQPGDDPITEAASLSLCGFELDPGILIRRCPNLKNFHIAGCTLTTTVVRISNVNLDSFEFELGLYLYRRMRALDLEMATPNLQALTLVASKMFSFSRINIDACKSLRRLVLHFAPIGVDWIQNYLYKSNFLMLEHLELQSCDALARFHFSGDRLKNLELIRCEILDEVWLDTPNLQSFRFTGAKEKEITCLKLDIASCRGIRIIKLERVTLRASSEFFDKILPQLKFIEDLTFDSCSFTLGCFQFVGDRLKNLELIRCEILDEVRLDTPPNLQSFRFTGTKEKEVTCLKLGIASCRGLRIIKLGSLTLSTSDDFFDKILPQLEFIEDLTFDSCFFALRCFQIAGDRLKNLEVIRCEILDEVWLDTPNLQSFRFTGTKEKEVTCLKLGIASCRGLRIIKLESLTLSTSDDFFDKILPRLEFIEDLTFNSCSFQTNKISSAHVISLQLSNCGNLELVEIDTPNLRKYCYYGGLNAHPESLISSGLLQAEIKFTYPEGYPKCYELRRFFIMFGHCKLLTLRCDRVNDLLFKKEEKDGLLSPMYALKHLRVELERSGERSSNEAVSYGALLHRLLWLAPRLEVLTIVRESKEQVIKLQYVKRLSIPDLYCCRDKPFQCWRHNLSSFTLENFENSKEENSVHNFFAKNVLRRSVEGFEESSESTRLGAFCSENVL